ncbi:MAG: hypothetical protein ACUVR3_14430 [Candidatus Roseilinea sp.]|uniref:hypothetical protein n=1 Tax=Candidatus Roseilinea sp. TaxID=2838777 RepID=UPI004049BB39
MLFEGNLIYLFAAYVVFLGGIALYLVSLFLRQRNLERQAHALEKIAREIKDEG